MPNKSTKKSIPLWLRNGSRIEDITKINQKNIDIINGARICQLYDIKLLFSNTIKLAINIRCKQDSKNIYNDPVLSITPLH